MVFKAFLSMYLILPIIFVGLFLTSLFVFFIAMSGDYDKIQIISSIHFKFLYSSGMILNCSFIFIILYFLFNTPREDVVFFHFSCVSFSLMVICIGSSSFSFGLSASVALSEFEFLSKIQSDDGIVGLLVATGFTIYSLDEYKKAKARIMKSDEV